MTSLFVSKYSRASRSVTLYLIRSNRQRFYSIKPDDLGPKASQKARSRVARLNSKLPRFLQHYTVPLINAPLTHISSFLLLHELTAVVPLFALAATFHYTNWMPPYISEGKWISDGVMKFGNYFRKKGWLREEGSSIRHTWWGRGEGGVKIITELATAYAITKVLLPLRLIISISATPWFAKVAIIPITNMFRRIWKKG